MIVDVDRINKRYGKVEVLNDLCLQVPEGAAFALIGTNGAGKTTTLRVLVNITLRPDVVELTLMIATSGAISRAAPLSRRQLLPGIFCCAPMDDQ